MYFNRQRSVRVSVLLALMVFCVLPSLMDRSGMKAATCVMNPVVINNADSGAGSLRQAILDACDGSTITFTNTAASPITLTSELAIDKNLTIQGPGAGALTISGNNAVRVFNIGSINPGINVTLSGLTIANGSAPASTIIPGFFPGAYGGGIFNASTGTLTLTNSVVSGNNATNGGGGGIANASSGTVNVINSTLSDNVAGGGGGIASLGSGVVNVTNSTFSGNNAQAGGALLNFSSGLVNAGTITVSNSTFSGNSASSGGAIETDDRGTVTITGSTFSGNSAIDGRGDGVGGAISSFDGAAVTIKSSTFCGNTAVDGGAIDSQATLIVENCIFSGNEANGVAAIINLEGTCTITGSTFSNNIDKAGGGVIFNATLDTTLTVANCTFWRNAGAAGAQFPVIGVLNFTGTVNVASSTFSGNDVAITGATNVRNTIIAGGTSGLSNVFKSQGHNLIEKDDGLLRFLNGINGDQVGSTASPLDAKLGPLQNNGGPTPTMALLPGSPAIEAGDDSVLSAPLFLATDQRGFPRRSGVHVDIGAFEVQEFFDTCLKDNSSGNLLQFNSLTGQYKFIRCSDGFMLSGTGVVRLVNGILTLTDSKPDRRVSAGFITSQRTGSATIYIMIAPGVWQTFRINSTNPNAVCGC